MKIPLLQVLNSSWNKHPRNGFPTSRSQSILTTEQKGRCISSLDGDKDLNGVEVVIWRPNQHIQFQIHRGLAHILWPVLGCECQATTSEFVWIEGVAFCLFFHISPLKTVRPKHDKTQGGTQSSPGVGAPLKTWAGQQEQYSHSLSHQWN